MDETRTDQPLYVAKAELFRSLGHPVRIRILELLVAGEKPVSVLLSEIGVEPSSLSQHLNVLKHTGLVVSSRKGNGVTYQVTSARAVLASTLGRTRQTLEHLEAPR